MYPYCKKNWIQIYSKLLSNTSKELNGNAACNIYVKSLRVRLKELIIWIKNQCILKASVQKKDVASGILETDVNSIRWQIDNLRYICKYTNSLKPILNLL